jgi:hypothetical protein
VTLQKVLDQFRDLFLPRPQLGKMDRHDGESIVEVLSEISLLDRVLEIAVRGRYHPDVHVDRLRVSDPSDLSFLQSSKELHLQGAGQLTDLVEKECAAVSGLEETLLVAIGTGERALYEPEEFGLEELFRDSPTVHGEKDDLPKPGVRPHFGPQASDLGAQLLPLLCLLDNEQHVIGTKGLRDVVVRALLHRFQSEVESAIGGHDQHKRSAPGFPVRLEESDPVHLGHADIAQDHVRRLLLGSRETLLAILCLNHVVPGIAEDQRE